MEELVRIRVGRFLLEDSVTLDTLAEKYKEGCLGKLLLPMDGMFKEYPGLTVGGRWDSLAKNGNPLPKKAFLKLPDPRGWKDKKAGEPFEYVRIYDEKGQFIAVGRLQEKECRIVKMFYVNED